MSRKLVPAVLIAAFALVAPAAAQADTVITWSQARLAATNDGAGTSVNLSTAAAAPTGCRTSAPWPARSTAATVTT